MYELYAQVAGAKIVWISYGLDDFSFPIEEILKAIRPSTRLIALANPNNPTGSFLKKDELAQLVALCRARNLALISDEVFADYPNDDGRKEGGETDRGGDEDASPDGCGGGVGAEAEQRRDCSARGVLCAASGAGV